ncbi:MAG: metallophosphoesterase [Gammaproteobacteria bacterium]|nr:metallophosphoesterase [Gammaproteobacteria bacterium]
MSRTLFALATLLATTTAVAQQPAEAVFVQIADPQFGMFTEDADFVQETANFEFAIANINRLKPAFVVICGDLINKPGDGAQRDEYLRISAQLDPAIRLYAAAGNHDVGNAPTPESLREYREHFGPDYYSFEDSGIYGIVLNSSLLVAPQAVSADADAQERWLIAELEKARRSDARHIVVFQHYSWFIEHADEPDMYFNIPLETRRRYLALFRDAGVRYLFSGHYHRNALASDGPLEMITSGPVGKPLGDGASGLRVVRVMHDRLEHQYFPFGNIPNALDVPAQGPARSGL